jgi:hypothetical protein
VVFSTGATTAGAGTAGFAGVCGKAGAGFGATLSSAGAGLPLHSAIRTIAAASFGRIARIWPPLQQFRHGAMRGAVQRPSTIET